MEPEAPDSLAHRGHHALGLATSVLGALLGFALVAFIGVRSTPGPEDFPITPKLAYLREHIGEYDAVFVGRSHVMRSYIPAVIDAELARLGKPLRSFNMGGPGLSDVEIDRVLREVLAMKGQALRYAFVEVPDWTYGTDDNEFTNRAVDVHTPLQTARLLEAIYLSDMPVQEWPAEAWKHVRMFGQHITAFGQGKRIVGAWRGEVEPQPITQQAIARDGGYQSLESLDLPEIARRREKFLRNPAGYAARVRKLIEGNAEDFDLDRYNRAALLDQIELVRAAGVEPVYMVPPSMNAMPHATALLRAGLIPNLLRFNDPVAFPGLYRFASRFDGHLTRAGAEEFSLYFARSFARLE